jgi:Transcription factor Opi1
MESLLEKIKNAVEEANQALDRSHEDSEHSSGNTQSSSFYRSTLTSVSENWSKVSNLWRWMPTFTSSVQTDIAVILRKVFQLVSKNSVTLPQSLQSSIRQFLLSLPSKWAAFTFRLTTWTTTSMLFNPKSSLEHLHLLSDLVVDTIEMLQNIKHLVVCHLEKSGISTSSFMSSPNQNILPVPNTDQLDSLKSLTRSSTETCRPDLPQS